MSDPNTPQPPGNDKHFSDMAAKIAANKDNGFGGALVIVSPQGRTISSLSLDQPADEAIFWATIKSRVALIEQELADADRTQGWGGRR